MQLLGVRGPVRVENREEGYAAVVDWDRALLPSCQIWISDRALQRFPWRGMFRGLGIEPTASAFDFAQKVSGSPNPIVRRGYATAVPVKAGDPVTIRYSVELSDL